MSYDRVRIEVDVTKIIPTVIHVEHPDGRMFRQQVVYEWIPYFCIKCHEVGHIYDQRKKANWQWVPKQVTEAVPKDPVVPEAAFVVVTPEVYNSHALSDHEGGWVVATKVSRSNARLQRSFVSHSRGIQKLGKEFHRLQEGLQMVLEEKHLHSS